MTALLFLRSYWKLIGFGLIVLALSIQTIRLGHRTNQLEAAKINLNECRAGREADRTAYREAQARAAEMNRAEVQRIETQQKEITDDIQARYLSDLARLKRLRQQPAPEGSSRGSQAGEVPNPATGVDGENLPVPRSELLRCENDAAEIELKSNYLIDWVKQQLGVER